MARGLKKDTTKWSNKMDSNEQKHRMVQRLAIQNTNKRCAVNFRHAAKLVLPFKSCGDLRIDREIAVAYTVKYAQVDDTFFKENVLHHETDGSMMWVDKVLHTKTPHVGYRFLLKEKLRAEAML
jgi:hypothetical protein